MPSCSCQPKNPKIQKPKKRRAALPTFSLFSRFPLSNSLGLFAGSLLSPVPLDALSILLLLHLLLVEISTTSIRSPYSVQGQRKVVKVGTLPDGVVTTTSERLLIGHPIIPSLEAVTPLSDHPGFLSIRLRLRTIDPIIHPSNLQPPSPPYYLPPSTRHLSLILHHRHHRYLHPTL